MEVAELNIERLKLADVSHHIENPRYHSREQIEKIAESIQAHGFAKGSMTVQRSTMQLVAGNGVYDALVLLDYEEADFVVEDMTDAEALTFLIRDNRLGELSRWDMPVLNANLAKLGDMNIKLEETAFELSYFAEAQDDPNPPIVSDDQWVSMTFRVPKAVVDIVESEIDRIGDVLSLDVTLPENVQRGLILEAICANSALTPIQSLT